MKKTNSKFLRSVTWATNILQRYVEGKLTDEQQQMVEEQLREVDDMTDSLKNPISESQLNKSDKRIKHYVFTHLGLDLSVVASRRKLVLNTARKYTPIAAMIAVLIGTSFFLINQRPRLMDDHITMMGNVKPYSQTQAGETKEVELPDGTHIYLNDNSKLDYIADRFDKKRREIWLEGEAFFEVAHNPDKPFIIHTGDFKTVVRGTSFNVKAYKEIGEIDVTVRTGKVEVGTGKEIFGMLTPNKQIVYNEQTGEHKINDANYDDAMAWQDGRLVLKDANLAELKLRIKQLYNVNLEVNGTALNNVRFGLSFNADADLNDVLDMIGMIYNVTYEKEGNTVVFVP